MNINVSNFLYSPADRVSMRNSFCFGATIYICCLILHIAFIFTGNSHILCCYRAFCKTYWRKCKTNGVAFRFLILYWASSASICNAMQIPYVCCVFFSTNLEECYSSIHELCNPEKISKLMCNMQNFVKRKFAEVNPICWDLDPESWWGS